MKIKFLNKTIENQRFNYNPRYYDERKEQLASKKKLFKELDDKDTSGERRKEIFRDSIKGEYSRAQYRNNEKRTSNYRILLLILIIVTLGYFVFNGVDEVDTVVKKLW